MPTTDTTEKRFEMDIADFLLSPAGGYTGNHDVYDPRLGLFPVTLCRFVQKTQPKEWARFVMQNQTEPERKFCLAFNNACDADGLLSVLRHGFKHRGVSFRVCYFRPESGLNQTAAALYAKNEITCNRQWFYSAENHNSVDMVLAVNGIPVFAFELKNQYTGQNVEDAKRQWMYDRDPREICFQFNKRILGFFCVDQLEVWMTTKLAGKDTFFLPFNQGSNGAGNDGGKGNPANPDGYPTAYLWERVFRKDSMMDILQKFIHLQTKEEKKRLPDGSEQTIIKKTLIFPRYHQLDVVRKLLADVRANGAGHNYLIQHSAGSGKSNSIAWTAYRLASLHDDENKPVFSSVIVVTDRTVLDAQLQETISGFDHTLGAVETIGEDKSSKDLRDAINEGRRIIVTTLQKFPVIYQEVDKAAGRNYAVIVDEAHSSQTGSSALKLKAALADTEEALREYAELEGKAEEELDLNNKLLQEMLVQGKHQNLSFFAFTATPKAQTLEIFGTEWEDGSFHPFHVYSMRQAIEEGFILDVLQNYMTYATCFKIAKNTPENPELPESRATKIIRKLKEHGTEVYFEKENIWTFDSKGELLLTIMSSLAQEESRSISLNVTWGQRKRFADGKATVPFGRFLGYDRGEHVELVINEEEADTVRIIYAEFLAGLSYTAIAKKLTELGIKSPAGNDVWNNSTVKSILSKLRTTDLIRRKRQHPLKTACYKGFCGQGGAFRLMCGAGKRAGMRIGPCTMDTITL